MQLRLPPQDIEAEEAVLASCMIDQSVVDDAAEVLVPGDFYRGPHQKIFRAVLAVRNSKNPVDLLTVRAALQDAGDLESAGGAAYLGQLTSTSGIVVNTGAYCQRVKDKAILRALLVKAQQIGERCFDGGPADEILDWAQGQVMEIDLPTTGHWHEMAELSSSTVDRIEAAMRGDNDRAVRTMLPTIDHATGGGLRGPLLGIIAGRPRMGKTALMTTLTANMARRGDTVGVFSIEMPKEQLDLRWLSMMTGINTVALRSGHRIMGGRRVPLSAKDWEAIVDASDRKSRWKVMVDDTAGLKVQELKRRARRMAKAGAQVIFIDQLSKIRGGDGQSRYEQKSSIVNELAELKKEIGIPVMLLAQINRKPDDRGKDKEPTISDLKDTGSLEEDADIILIIHREYEYSQDARHEREAIINIAKHRNGPERRILVAWDAQRTTFYEEEKQ